MPTANQQAMTLMVQGTTSDAGKSTLVAGICRILAREKVNVAPFKPQNMAHNSAVTKDGGEIGRAQAVQAHAALIEPEVDFNPILLKPNSDTGAQVIVHGKALTSMEAQSYHDYKKQAMQAVLESHQRLTERFDYIIVEGAGSPAEINLREGDIANMGFAEQVDCPVILIADIDRGGVFAHLVGTLELLSPSEQNRVVGFVINRFRGDIKLLEPGLDWLEQKTKKPVLAVLPYLHGLTIAAEDAVDEQQQLTDVTENGQNSIKVIVLVTPRMSNHSDFDNLRWHPNINFQFIYGQDLDSPNIDRETAQQPLPPCDLLILPGSKNVQADLAFIIQQGWDICINRHLRYGGKVMGICGGMQMLGHTLADPDAIESEVPMSQGLGLLPLTTTLSKQKTLTNVTGTLHLNEKNCAVSGYEIHAGITKRLDLDNEQQVNALISINGKDEGYVSADQQIIGSYWHGIFDTPSALKLIMQWAGAILGESKSFKQQQNIAIDKLADAIAVDLDFNKIKQLAQVNNINDKKV
ncbi:cobyric acid synthase [Thalassotalea sp. ND16A]|uniref:cobyric acid synthase n=1 Tax=Thalassotalea sp. ND16A TaxID=1535422 RepID=UPI00051A4D61|nr:cobyric acid synthase [Thalassotalea sp. ND16A]